MENIWLVQDEIEQLNKKKNANRDRCERIGILEGITSNRIKTNTALLLENQRLYNETNTDNCDIDQFKRISIPLIRRIAAGMVANILVSVQPGLYSNCKNCQDKHHIFYNYTNMNGEWLRRDPEPVRHEFRKMKAVWSYEAYSDLRSYYGLDAEAELTAVLAQELTLEMDRRVIHNLRTNCGTNDNWDWNTALGGTIMEKYESLYVKMVRLSEVVHAKTGKTPNWILTSPEVASIFETATAGFSSSLSETLVGSLGVQYVGVINNRWKLYKDPLYPTNSLMMGYYDEEDPYCAGYVWAPRVLLKQGPVVLDPDSFCPRKPILSEDMSRFVEGGERYYANLKITNFVI